MPVEGVVHAVLVQSTVARGRLLRLETAAAEAAPGVLAVLTPASLPPLREVEADFGGDGKPGGGTVPGERRVPLSDDRVHHAGQDLAVVVADTIEQARHAASLVAARYEEEPPLLGVDNPSAPALGPADLGREDLEVRRGDPERGFARAGAEGVVVDATYATPAEHHNPMEPSATTAVWEGDRLTVYDSTQWVVGTRNALARALGIPEDHVRVVCPFVGGGFGCKGWTWPHTLLAAAAAKALGRPVRLALTRPQMFTSVGYRPPTVQRVALAAGRDGRLLAASHHVTHHTSFLEDYVEAAAASTTRVLYAIPNLSLGQRVVRLNLPTPTAMRAPGECPGTFALECAMDELACALRMDPVELRLVNHADVDPDNGRPWSSKRLRECYALGAEKFGWEARSPEPRSMRDGRLLVGWGMATAVYPAYRWAAAARAEIQADGTATVACAAHDLGTGAYTVFTQVAADALGLPPERVTVQLGDSSLPGAPVAGGSNTTASVSPVVAGAARKALRALVRLAVADRRSPLHGLPEAEVAAENGRLRSRRDGRRSEAFAEVLARAGRASVSGRATSQGRGSGGRYSFHSFGAQFCEAKVDPDLGEVRVTRFVGAFDVGRVLNPRTASSQIMGGTVMGIGMALMEAAAYDERTGRCVNDNLADYPVCVNADVGRIETCFVDEPDPHINELGCRGIGEIAITGVAAAVANAVFHATGRRVRDLPITPEKLL
jgi:xanthine dehydrogenase YagR molybdenum-binding subunit